MGSLTHLTIGKERIPSKPPRSVPPCSEPTVYGANIIKDPNFELHLANTGGGPNGDELPGYEWGTTPTSWSELQWSDSWATPPTKSSGGTLADLSTCWISAGLNDLVTPNRVFISTSNPDSGTYHLRTVGTPLWIFFTQQRMCTGPNLGDEFGYYYTGRCKTADFIRFSARMSAASARNVTMYVDFFDETGNKDRTLSALKSVTTSYATYEFLMFVPPPNYGPPVHHFTAYLGFTGATVLDVDSVGLGLTE